MFCIAVEKRGDSIEDLLLADTESESLWEYFDKSKIADYSLILSAGDLHGEYLSFLATFAHVPVLYVHGNHDTRYMRRPPEGCLCIEDTIFEYRGIRILGAWRFHAVSSWRNLPIF